MQTPENTVETVSLQTTMQLLQTTPAVAMLAESMVEPEIQAGRLTRLALPFPLVLADYGVITRRIQLRPQGIEALDRSAKPPASLRLQWFLHYGTKPSRVRQSPARRPEYKRHVPPACASPYCPTHVTVPLPSPMTFQGR